MKKFKLLDKLKKVILIILCAITVFFSMPKKSDAGIIQDFVQLILYIPDGIMWLLNEHVAGSESETSIYINTKGTGDGTYGYMYNFDVTPYDIFTSGLTYKMKNIDGSDGEELIKLPILDINFFKKGLEGSKSSAEVLRPTISNVYYSLRNIVLIVMLVVLLYVGIRILIASAVSDQVKYKQWIMDWVVGICLVVLLQYIMSFMMNINEIIVEMLGENREASYYISLSKLSKDVGGWDPAVRDKADTDVGYYIFYAEHLAVANATSNTKYDFDVDTATIYIDPSKGDTDRSDWGNNGTVFINARIVKDEFDASTTTAGWAGSGLGGAAAGAAIGSIVPGIGTGVGALIGAGVGLFTYGSVKAATGGGSEGWADKAVYRCNLAEYVRTITSFGSKWVVEFKPSGTYAVFNSQEERDLGDESFYGYAILYILLVIESCMFLYTYLKRVFKLAFYTMIAPLIAFMYPIDKLGDGKAQAFNTWFKEYLYNVLIQPLHLLLYTVFIYSAMSLMHESAIYAIAAYAYMIAAEKFFKKIFGFDKAPTGGPGGLGSPIAGAMAMKGLDALKGGSKGGAKSEKGSDGASKSKIKYAKRPTTANPPTNAPTSGGRSSVVPSFGGGSVPSSFGGESLSGSTLTGGGRTTSYAPGANGGNKGIPIVTRALRGIGQSIAGGANVLGQKTARKITGARTNSWREIGANPGLIKYGAENAGKAVLKGAGKAAVRAGGGLLGAAGGLAAGALVGMAASAFQGEDKMASSMQTGALGGMALGVGLGNGLANKVEAFNNEVSDYRAENYADYAVERAFYDSFNDDDYIKEWDQLDMNQKDAITEIRSDDPNLFRDSAGVKRARKAMSAGYDKDDIYEMEKFIDDCDGEVDSTRAHDLISAQIDLSNATQDEIRKAKIAAQKEINQGNITDPTEITNIKEEALKNIMISNMQEHYRKYKFGNL